MSHSVLGVSIQISNSYLDELQAPIQGLTATVWTGDETADYLINSKAAAAEAAGRGGIIMLKELDKIHKVLGTKATYYMERQQAPEAISRFISDLGWDMRSRAWERKRALQKAHFAMFPEYPDDLARFCEDNLFQESVLYVSKL